MQSYLPLHTYVLKRHPLDPGGWQPVGFKCTSLELFLKKEIQEIRFKKNDYHCLLLLSRVEWTNNKIENNHHSDCFLLRLTKCKGLGLSPRCRQWESPQSGDSRKRKSFLLKLNICPPYELDILLLGN
jgi:hypothetical protein